jgi:hypothetical protein
MSWDAIDSKPLLVSPLLPMFFTCCHPWSRVQNNPTVQQRADTGSCYPVVENDLVANPRPLGAMWADRGAGLSTSSFAPSFSSLLEVLSGKARTMMVVGLPPSRSSGISHWRQRVVWRRGDAGLQWHAHLDDGGGIVCLVMKALLWRRPQSQGPLGPYGLCWTAIMGPWLQVGVVARGGVNRWALWWCPRLAMRRWNGPTPSNPIGWSCGGIVVSASFSDDGRPNSSLIDGNMWFLAAHVEVL